MRALEAQMRTLQARLDATRRRRAEIASMSAPGAKGAASAEGPAAAQQRTRAAQMAVEGQMKALAALEQALGSGARYAQAGGSQPSRGSSLRPFDTLARSLACSSLAGSASAAGRARAPTSVTPAAFARAVHVHLACRHKQLAEIRANLGDNAARLRSAKDNLVRRLALSPEMITLVVCARLNGRGPRLSPVLATLSHCEV